jgi:hypothetical protein
MKNPPTASTFAFAPNHTNQPQGQSQKSLPTDKSEKEIFKNAPPHNKNKIHHSRHRTHTTEDRTTTPNSGFKKLAVQWLNEHSTSHQHLWWLDSLVLRNRQLLKPAKR